MNEFSFYRHPISRITPNSAIGIKATYEYLRSERLRTVVTRIRQEGDAAERRAIKSGELDFVTFSGIFSKRRADKIEQHSGLLCLDYDHIGSRETLRAKKQELKIDRSLGIQLIFVSPSGDGLKVVVRIGVHQSRSWEELQQWHKSEYARVAGEIEERHGLRSDNTSDIARACYLSWDPEAYLAGETYSGREAKKAVSFAAACERSSREIQQSSREKVEQALRRVEDMHRDVTREYRDWVRMGFGLANEFGELGREYYHRVSRFYPYYRHEETEAKYDECMYKGKGKVKLGTVLWLMKK